MGAGEKQDPYFLSLSKVAVTKSLFILEKNTRDAMWGLVLAQVHYINGKNKNSYRKLKKIIVAFNLFLHLQNGIIHILRHPLQNLLKLFILLFPFLIKFFIYSGVAVQIVSIEATENNARIQLRREWKWKEDGKIMTLGSNNKHDF